MSAPVYTVGAVVNEWQGGHDGGRAYPVRLLPVDRPEGGRSWLRFTRHRDRWVASHATRTFTDDGHEWSAWGAVVHLALAGVLESVNRGPGTFGHTDYMLPE